MTIITVQEKDIANIIHLSVWESRETRSVSRFQVERTLPTDICYPSLVEPSMGCNPTWAYPIGIWTRPGPPGWASPNLRVQDRSVLSSCYVMRRSARPVMDQSPHGNCEPFGNAERASVAILLKPPAVIPPRQAVRSSGARLYNWLVGFNPAADEVRTLYTAGNTTHCQGG